MNLVNTKPLPLISKLLIHIQKFPLDTEHNVSPSTSKSTFFSTVTSRFEKKNQEAIHCFNFSLSSIIFYHFSIW